MKKITMAINKDCPWLFERYGNLFPNPTQYGIFTGLDHKIRQLGIPNYEEKQLNLLYFQRSKLKRVSTLVEDMIDIYGLTNKKGYVNVVSNFKFIVVDGIRVCIGEKGIDYFTLSEDGFKDIVDAIITKYFYNWSKLVDTYKKDYDMLSPFKMSVDDRSNDTLASQDVSDNNEQSVNTSTGDYQGFNSSEYNPVDKSVDSSVDNNHRTSAYNRSNAYTRVTERSGNIGNRSSQELIKEERGIWVWNIYNQMFSDIDKVLTKGIY